MLTNKKTGIRVLALILALMMTVAIFAGCSDSAAREEAEKAKADAAAAQAAAEAAKKAAEEAAKNLQEQLDAAKKEAEEAKKKAEEAQEAANNAGNKADDYHKDDGNAKDPVIDNEFNELTEKIKKDALLKFEALKNQYLVLQKTWYTTENLAKLQTIFEVASIELYRATSAEGIENLLADANAQAAAVDNVVSEAKAVQDLIVALGDVTKTVVLDAERRNTSVEAARAAFDAWVNKYATCFFVANGIPATYTNYVNGIFQGLKIAGNEKDIVKFAAAVTSNRISINVGDTTNSLLAAEDQVASLRFAATSTMDGILAAYLEINDLDRYTSEDVDAFIKALNLDPSTTAAKNAAATLALVVRAAEKSGAKYGDCKANAQAIEDAYLSYRLFFNANGGSADAVNATYGDVTLTADQFVKAYILCLYDGQLDEFKRDISNFLETAVVEFFMNDNPANLITVAASGALMLNSGYTVKDGTSTIDALKTPLTVTIEDKAIVVSNGATEVVRVKFDKVNFMLDLKKIASTFNANLFGYSYSADFKGTKTLAEAYCVVEQEIVKAVAAMTQVYYEEVVVAVMESFVEFHNIYIDALKTDAATTASAHAIMEAALAELKAVKVPTYDELNAAKNLTSKPVFYVNNVNAAYDTVGLYPVATSALGVIASEYATTVNNALKAYYASEMLIEEAVEFVNAKADVIALVNKLACIPAGTYKAADHEAALTAQGFFTAATANGLTTTKIADFAKSVKAAADQIIAKINAVTYLDENNAPKYADAVVNVSSKWKLSTGATNKDPIAYTLKQSRVDVAVADLVSVATADVNTVLLNAYSGLVKTALKTNVTNAIDLYKKQYSFDNLDLVGVNLKNDMVEMADYLSAIADLYDAAAANSYKEKYGINLFAVDEFNVELAKTYHVTEASTALGYYTNIVATDAKITGIKLADVATAPSAYYVRNNVPVDVTDKVTTSDEYTKFVSAHAQLVGTYTVTSFSTEGTETVADNYLTYAEQDLNRMIEIGLKGTYAGKTVSSVKVYELLDSAKDLLYMKDSLINSTGIVSGDTVVFTPVKIAGTDYTPVNGVYAKYTGNTLDGYKFEPNTLRTQLYLKRLAEVKDRAVALIASINLVNSNLDKDEAQAKLAAVMTNLDAETPVYTVATSGAFKGECADDYSFAIAYARFYQTPSTYQWLAYEGKLQPND